MSDGDGGSEDGDGESRSERINREIIELLNEVRIGLVGVQVLFGFLLAVPFSQGFVKVTDFQRDLFFFVLASTAIASALMVAPSAYHRINFRAKDKEQMLRTANGLMIVGFIFVALSIVGSVTLVADVIYGQPLTWISATGGLALFAALWFALPLIRRDPHVQPEE